MARPKKNPKVISTPQLHVPRTRYVFTRMQFYLPKTRTEELNEWMPALSTMQGQVIPPVLLAPVEEYQLTAGEAILHFSFHYIIKNKWDRHHPLPPYPNQLKSLLSYFANTWLCTLELCIQCRDFLPTEELQKFLRASDWFEAIVREDRKTGFNMIRSHHQAYLQKRMQPYTEPKQPNKHDIVPEMRAFLKELKKFRNPYTQEEDTQMYRLIDIAQKLAQRRSRFRKEYWDPYIQSLERKIKLIETDDRISVIQERDGYPVTHGSNRTIKLNKQHATRGSNRTIISLGNHLFPPVQNGSS